MVDAQELLEQVTPGNRLISKLQLCMKDLDYPGGNFISQKQNEYTGP